MALCSRSFGISDGRDVSNDSDVYKITGLYFHKITSLYVAQKRIVFGNFQSFL